MFYEQETMETEDRAVDRASVSFFRPDSFGSGHAVCHPSGVLISGHHHLQKAMVSDIRSDEMHTSHLHRRQMMNPVCLWSCKSMVTVCLSCTLHR